MDEVQLTVLCCALLVQCPSMHFSLLLISELCLGQKFQTAWRTLWTGECFDALKPKAALCELLQAEITVNSNVVVECNFVLAFGLRNALNVSSVL